MTYSRLDSVNMHNISGICTIYLEWVAAHVSQNMGRSNIYQSTVFTVLSLQRNHQSQYICNQQYLIFNSLFSTQMKASILLHASIKSPVWSWVRSKTLIYVCSASCLLLFISITVGAIKMTAFEIQHFVQSRLNICVLCNVRWIFISILERDFVKCNGSFGRCGECG